MTPEGFLEKHKAAVIRACREMTPASAQGAEQAAFVSAILNDEERIEGVMPPHRPSLPGEDAFWWCVEQMALLSDVRRPASDPYLAAMVEDVRRFADLIEDGEPLPDGYTVDWREAALGPKPEGDSPETFRHDDHLRAAVPVPRGTLEFCQFALRAVLTAPWPWRQALEGQPSALADVRSALRAPAGKGGEGDPLRGVSDDRRQQAENLAERLFATLAVGGGPGVTGAVERSANADGVILAPWAKVDADSVEAQVVVESQIGPSLHAVAEAVSALVREGGLDAVAFPYFTADREGFGESAGLFDRLETGVAVCDAGGPQYESAHERARGWAAERNAAAQRQAAERTVERRSEEARDLERAVLLEACQLEAGQERVCAGIAALLEAASEGRERRDGWLAVGPWPAQCIILPSNEQVAALAPGVVAVGALDEENVTKYGCDSSGHWVGNERAIVGGYLAKVVPFIDSDIDGLGDDVRAYLPLVIHPDESWVGRPCVDPHEAARLAWWRSKALAEEAELDLEDAPQAAPNASRRSPSP